MPPPLGVLLGVSHGMMIGMQEPVGELGALLVGAVDEPVWVGELDEECDADSSLEECAVVVGEELWLRLFVGVWWELGALKAPVSEPLLVPVGAAGAVADGAFVEEVWVGVPLLPCDAFPEPPSTTAAAPATRSTAVVTAPTRARRPGPPEPAAGPGSSKSSVSSSRLSRPARLARSSRPARSPLRAPLPAAAASTAAPAAASTATSSSIRVASDSSVLSRSGLSTCV